MFRAILFLCLLLASTAWADDIYWSSGQVWKDITLDEISWSTAGMVVRIRNGLGVKPGTYTGALRIARASTISATQAKPVAEKIGQSPTTNTIGWVTGGAIDVVRSYLAALNWEDRVSYVLYPEIVRPHMQTYYAGRRWKPEEIDFMITTAREPQPTPDGWVAVEARTGRLLSVLYLLRVADSYKIDWVSSVGFNSISPASFRATRPRVFVRFRAIAKLDDYYNYEFSGQENGMWSIDLNEANHGDIGHGYIQKNGPDGHRLFQCLKDGKEHRVVVDLCYTPFSQSPSVFLISRVVAADTWWYAEVNTVPPASRQSGTRTAVPIR